MPVAIEGRVAAVVGLGDPIRDESPQALALLGRLGWRVRILSGDHPDVVAAVAARLGLTRSGRPRRALPGGESGLRAAGRARPGRW